MTSPINPSTMQPIHDSTPSQSSLLAPVIPSSSSYSKHTTTPSQLPATLEEPKSSRMPSRSSSTDVWSGSGTPQRMAPTAHSFVAGFKYPSLLSTSPTTGPPSTLLSPTGNRNTSSPRPRIRTCPSVLSSNSPLAGLPVVSGSDTDAAITTDESTRRDSLSTPFLSPDASGAAHGFDVSKGGIGGYFNPAWSPITPTERNEFATFSDIEEGEAPDVVGGLHPISLLTALLHEKGMVKDRNPRACISPVPSSGPSSAVVSRVQSRKPSGSEETPSGSIMNKQALCAISANTAVAATCLSGKISFAPEPFELSRSRSRSMSDKGKEVYRDTTQGLPRSPSPHAPLSDGQPVSRVPTPILLRRETTTPMSSAPSSRRPSDAAPRTSILLPPGPPSTASSPEVSRYQPLTPQVTRSQSLQPRGRTSCLTFAVGCTSDMCPPLLQTPMSAVPACKLSPPTSPARAPPTVGVHDRSRRSSAASLSGDQAIGRFGLGVGLGGGKNKMEGKQAEIEEEQEEESEEDEDAEVEASYDQDEAQGASRASHHESIISEVVDDGEDDDDDDDPEEEGDQALMDEEEDDPDATDSELEGGSGYEEDSEASDHEEDAVKESRIVSPAIGRGEKPTFGRSCWSRGSPREGKDECGRPHFSPSALLRSTGRSLFPRSPRPNGSIDEMRCATQSAFPFARPTNYRRRHRATSAVSSNQGDGHIIGGSVTSLVGSFVLIDPTNQQNDNIHRGRGLVQIVDPVSDHKNATKMPMLKESCSRHCSPPPTSSVQPGRRSRSPSATNIKHSILSLTAAPKAGSSPSACRLKAKRDLGKPRKVVEPSRGRTAKGSPMPKRMVMTDVDKWELDGDSTSDAPLTGRATDSEVLSTRTRAADIIDLSAKRQLPSATLPQQLALTGQHAPANTAGHVVDGMITAIRRASISVNPFRRSTSVEGRPVLDGENVLPLSTASNTEVCQ